MKPWLKTLLKLAVTALAFYLVFRQVSWTALRDTLAGINPLWFLAAFLLYNLSQVLSSWRLLGFYHNLNLPIGFRQNLAVYYRAMFYGLFLPGGVSGDAYKVMTYQKQFQQPYRSLIMATLSDRVTGLAMLMSILGVLVILVSPYLPIPVKAWPWLLAAAIGIGWVLVYGIGRRFAAIHTSQIPMAALQSAGVQTLQLLAFFCILQGMGIPPAEWIRYAVLFYAGSILSSLPVSMGGMGMREWAMVTGSGLFGLASAPAFAASFSFFLVSSCSALAGAAVRIPDAKPLQNPETVS